VTVELVPGLVEVVDGFGVEVEAFGVVETFRVVSQSGDGLWVVVVRLGDTRVSRGKRTHGGV